MATASDFPLNHFATMVMLTTERALPQPAREDQGAEPFLPGPSLTHPQHRRSEGDVDRRQHDPAPDAIDEPADRQAEQGADERRPKLQHAVEAALLLESEVVQDSLREHAEPMGAPGKRGPHRDGGKDDDDPAVMQPGWANFRFVVDCDRAHSCEFRITVAELARVP